jgi:poly(3-hydroxybutyrate) depolymerase
MPAFEHHIAVTRTARYHTLGDPAAAREVWFVLHGHAQLSEFFIRHFAVLDDGTRLIVAPEGLNRFYLEGSASRASAKSRVGATWMTREDRLADIADYVGFLDKLYQHTFAAIDRDQVRVVVLGFSQGVSTALRWLCQGSARADLLVLWAGPIPDELKAATAAPLRALRVVRVFGNDDHLADALPLETSRIEALGVQSELIRFDGGHELNADVLRSLAR